MTGLMISGIISLTHWGWVTHICVSKLTIIGSDNGLSPGRRQAIIWTNAGILLIRTIGTNFSEISSEIHAFSFKKMQLKMSSAKWRPFCLGLNVLKIICTYTFLHVKSYMTPKIMKLCSIMTEKICYKIIWNNVRSSVRCTFPDSKVYGAHLVQTGPRWAPCWSRELCYLGCSETGLNNLFDQETKSRCTLYQGVN